MRIVHKYGGSSVASIKQIKDIANHIKKLKSKIKDIVIVVSAMGKTTNNLIALAKEIATYPNRRELDMLVSTGEVQSASLMAMALQDIGVNAISLNGKQAGFLTDSVFSRAFIEKINPSRIEKELAENKVVIVTGFQGVDKEGNTTTLGRGGSDTTAVALAAVLGCPCEIYTDVDAVHGVDPRVYNSNKKLKKISYDTVMEMAAGGSKVLEVRCVELAKKYKVNLYLGKTLEKGKSKGTYVMAKDYFEKTEIKNISVKEDILNITVKTESKNIKKIAEVIKNEAINLDMLKISVGEKFDAISFNIPVDNLQSIKKQLKKIEKTKLQIKENLIKITLIGDGMTTHTGIFYKAIEVLIKNKIKIHQVSNSEISLCFLIASTEKENAVKSLAKEFML